MNSELFLTKLSGIIVGKILNIRAETVEQGCPEINLVWADNSNVFISEHFYQFIGKFTEKI